MVVTYSSQGPTYHNTCRSGRKFNKRLDIDIYTVTVLIFPWYAARPRGSTSQNFGFEILPFLFQSADCVSDCRTSTCVVFPYLGCCLPA